MQTQTLKAWYTPSPTDSWAAQPWMCSEAIRQLHDLLAPDMRVLEHGSGGSTVWMAQLVSHVTAIENTPEWYETVGRVTEMLDNVTLIFSEDGLYDGPGGFDLLLIDGEPINAKSVYLCEAEKLVKPGGFVVLDNANRPDYAGLRKRFGERHELIASIDGNSAMTKYLVTDFYRLRGDDAAGQ